MEDLFLASSQSEDGVVAISEVAEISIFLFHDKQVNWFFNDFRELSGVPTFMVQLRNEGQNVFCSFCFHSQCL